MDAAFSKNDEERPGAPPKFEGEYLEARLDEDPTQTQKELSKTLEVTQPAIFYHLKEIGMIRKVGKWVPYELKPRDVERRFFSLVNNCSNTPTATTRGSTHPAATPLGRTALVIAIERDDQQLVRLLLERSVAPRDALLHAIAQGNVEAAEILLEHEERNHVPGQPHSWEQVESDAATFSPDVTPLCLAAHHDNYEVPKGIWIYDLHFPHHLLLQIVRLLLDRGASLPAPHDVRCSCPECTTTADTLRRSRSRLHAYRALASGALLALASKDPLLAAFQLSVELRRLADIETEFRTEYLIEAIKGEDGGTNRSFQRNDQAISPPTRDDILGGRNAVQRDLRRSANTARQRQEQAVIPPQRHSRKFRKIWKPSSDVAQTQGQVPHLRPLHQGNAQGDKRQTTLQKLQSSTSPTWSLFHVSRKTTRDQVSRLTNHHTADSSRAGSESALRAVRQRIGRPDPDVPRAKGSSEPGVAPGDSAADPPQTGCPLRAEGRESIVRGGNAGVQFVAHPHVQQLLGAMWREDGGGSALRTFAMFPLLAAAVLVAPGSALAARARLPASRFAAHSASYCCFLCKSDYTSTDGVYCDFTATLCCDDDLSSIEPNVGKGVYVLCTVLLILASQRAEYLAAGWTERAYHQRGQLPGGVETAIMVYVLGFIWMEIRQLWSVGLVEYVKDMWNMVDFIVNTLYLAWIVLRLVSWLQVRGDQQLDPREKWNPYDPILVSEGMFGAANIFSFLKMVHIFSVSPHLGPLQISLGRMVIDIIKFFFFYTLVLFAFACGLNQLLAYYSMGEREVCLQATRGGHGPRVPACDIWRRFSNLFETSQTLFWASFGLIDLDSFELTGIQEYTRFWGMLMFGSYSVINIVVLLNLLVAMMSNSFQAISDSSRAGSESALRAVRQRTGRPDPDVPRAKGSPEPGVAPGDSAADPPQLAVHFEQKDTGVQFVAHPHVQQLLGAMWREDGGGSALRTFAMFPLLAAAVLVAPGSALAARARLPASAFCCSLRLLLLLSLGVRAGFIWMEIRQLWSVGLVEYVKDMWNMVDFIVNTLYLAWIVLRLVSWLQSSFSNLLRVDEEGPSICWFRANLAQPGRYVQVRGDQQLDPREKWNPYDPILVSEGMFGAANIFSFLKMVHIFSVSPHLGPLQISLGRMVIDIIKFFFFYTLVLFAFACGLNQLLAYYSMGEREVCLQATRGGHGPRVPACDIWRRFSNLFETSQTLFWASFGLIDLDSFELTGIQEYTRFWGMLMFGSYSVINIVVLLNLLVAMMSNSFQAISVSCDDCQRLAFPAVCSESLRIAGYVHFRTVFFLEQRIFDTPARWPGDKGAISLMTR
ncbi:TRPC1 [Cordylochernes scorpioides]|uniref:TRPC1 n=1 Tax=Cordylochernes scorpioides TaxID=51811 RepID=A0ABY6L878_9ARAC|nr:TRPC1 [Cordylochernes scorpioides]